MLTKKKSANHKVGVILASFCPPHTGHLNLIEYALDKVDQLYVIVVDRDGQQPYAHGRLGWLKEYFPQESRIEWRSIYMNRQAAVLVAGKRTWAERVLDLLPHHPDITFACAHYDIEIGNYADLARQMQCSYSYHAAGAIEVTEGQLRTYPEKYWKYILKSSRPYYAKRLVLVGASHTGKTSLAQALAKHFKTVVAEDWMSTYVTERGYTEEQIRKDTDLFALATYQQPVVENDAACDSPTGLVICDTDLTQVAAMHEYLNGGKNSPEIIRAHQTQRRSYRENALYLLSWHDNDWHREGESGQSHQVGTRAWFSQRLMTFIDQCDDPLRIMSGTWEERLQIAIKTCEDRLLDDDFHMLAEYGHVYL
ncbi:MAG TPA: AAA family ATPase [Nitrososphaera sp.]|nr:AAA family ATPase [Nitrososphaera sp.]